jgi:two-component system sensor kinase FixL
VVVRGRVERDHDGQAVQIRGVAFDITARKLAEESLKKSEEFNRAVLASLHSQIAILDRAGTILAVNDAWEKSATANGSSLSASGVGVNYLDICRQVAAGNPVSRQMLAGLNSVLNGARDFFDQEYRCDSPTKAQWFLLSIMPLKSTGGGAVVSHVDITQLKQAELEIQLHREELAHLSRVMSLSELSNSLAHELNQPLAIILTNAQAAQRLLAQSPPDLDEARDILTDIVSEDQRAGDIIRRLRALLKPGQAQRQLLSVNDLVEDVLRIARSDLIGRGVSVHVALAENMPAVLGDRIQLQQVMLNLILNACDALTSNPPAQRQLRLTTAYRDGRVVASVSDNGCGLPANPEKIFEPFYTTKKEGLGLGLHICRSIATAHQGRLWAENVSAVDANSSLGTTFHLELPVKDERSSIQ